MIDAHLGGGFFVGWVPMNYQAFTNDSFALIYEGIRGALASDDAPDGLDENPIAYSDGRWEAVCRQP